MLKNLSIIAVTIVTTFLSFAQSALAAELEWNQTKVEMELKPNQMEARAEFVVTNKGEKTVRIDRIQTSCGCTGSILDRKSIKPGESSTIIGTFEKGNRQGLNHNRLQVFLKGQDEPVETLHMIVQVPRLIKVSPAIIYWSPSSNKTARQVQINLDKRYLSEVSRVEYNPELLSLVEKEDPSNNADRILIVMPKSFDQKMRESISIRAIGDDDLIVETKVQIFLQP